MNSKTDRIDVNGVPLEGKWFGAASSGPMIVMLHEGLGSVSTWRDFPQQLAEATHMRIFAYSRASYGASPEVKLPREVNYMHREALDVLPGVLEAIGFERGVLLGHSDGGSIATIYAGSVQDHRVRGLVLIEPHFFVEDVNLAAIQQTAENYKTTNLREKLARHHKNVDNAFEGWRSAWLHPKFKESFNIRDSLAHIRVPILMIKGEHDPYSTLAQLEVAREDTYCPLEGVIIPGAGHSPQRDAPAMTLEVISNFLDRLRIHEEAIIAG